MRLNSIKINNYRTLENITIKFHGYYSSISGKNNAGKTTIINAIKNIFSDPAQLLYPFRKDDLIDYNDDVTQWNSNKSNIRFEYSVLIEKDTDPGLFLFIEKFSGQLSRDSIEISIDLSYSKDGTQKCVVMVNNQTLEEFESNEILKKFQNSELAIFHNSTELDIVRIIGHRRGLYHELILSKDEKKEIVAEQRRVHNKIQKLAKTQKEELTNLLGHLEEKYDVEFTIPEMSSINLMPLSINLKDKQVDIPLDGWGSGTQNRTRIMMSILHANHIKVKEDNSNRITPIIIIEEPESFLHPSAQAEFGRILRNLSADLQIQTIVTTHSPYMLSQENPESNILLDRKKFRGRLKDTYVVEIDPDNWMKPFSDILGLDNTEFEAWKNVVSSKSDKILLVEGEIDKEYLLYISNLDSSTLRLPQNIDIVPYGGKDSLKNTILLKFIMEKFKQVYVTFDLDARDELLRSMTSLNLIEEKNFLAIGVNEEGKECIEGLVPQSVLSQVYSENTDLVMKLTTQNNKHRKDARNTLKKKILEKFKSKQDYSESDLQGFKKVIEIINKAFM